MALKLMYITNDPETARIAENAGVDWIFIDLEILGKVERQGHKDTVISDHCIGDIKPVKSVLSDSKLLVRVNPVHNGSEDEIEQVIENGADIIMLPYFKNADEVKFFIKRVNGRAETCLLVETPEAVDSIDEILDIPGIDYVHIGLNDLHLGYEQTFMFELLADGTVESLCKCLDRKGLPYGFGGIASLGKGMLPSEYIIAEHYRLGSTMAILSRSFCNAKEITGKKRLESIFDSGVRKIREYEKRIENRGDDFYEENRRNVQSIIEKIVSKMEENNA